MTTRCDSPAFPFTELVPALKSTPDPNGYRPFTVGRDEIPILHSDLPRAYQSISELAVRSQVQKKAEAFFRRLGVEIVSDDVEDLTPKQIRASEVHTYYLLYCGIESGKSSISIDGDDEFEKRSLTAIRTLLSIPAGRYLILSISRSAEPVILKPDDHCHVHTTPTSKNVKVLLNLHEPIYGVGIDSRGKRKIMLNSHPIIIAHELIHVLHTLHKRRMMFQSMRFGMTPELDRAVDSMVEFTQTRAPNVDYTNLSELFTISGIPDKDYLCEQMIRYELGEERRYGHISSKFPPFNFIDPMDDPQAVIDGVSRVHNAAWVGDDEEMMMLLVLGADVQEAFNGAAQGGHVDIMKFLCDRPWGQSSSGPKSMPLSKHSSP